MTPQLNVSEHARTAPLSFAQERFWFLSQLDPESAAYIIAQVVRLRGTLDLEALQLALQGVVDRHDVLRTTYTLVDDRPMQVVRATTSLPLHVVDLSGDVAAGRGDQARRSALLERARPFDLSRDTPLRATVLRLSDTEHLLAVHLHHIAGDAWSLGVFWREVGELYSSRVTGRPATLPDLALQYTGFAAWQRDALDQERAAEGMAYWLGRLEGLSPAILTPDLPRPEHPSHRGDHVTITIPADVGARLQDLCRRLRLTPFMVRLAAFQVLLARLTGEYDVAVGLPIVTRSRPEVEHLIGLFLNTVVIRTTLEPTSLFSTVLGAVREEALGALEHQDLPYERLVAARGPAEDPWRSPLFQVLFNVFDEAPSTGPRLAGLETAFEMALDTEHAKFDLTIYGSGAELRANYDAEVFRRERVAELLDQYLTLLAQATANPDCPISEYSLVTMRAAAVLPDAKAALPAPPVTRMAPHAVLDQAVRHGTAVAIGGTALSCTYATLARAACHVARELRNHGVAGGDVVALEGVPSVGLYAGLLGIMLAGGVALPLDPTLPAARKRSMVGQARAGRILSVGVPPEARWWRHDATDVIEVEIEPARGAVVGAVHDLVPAAPEEPFAIPEWLPRLDPESPAYVFFTSGSTGEPKGILGHHLGLAHFVEWQREAFRVGPGDGVAQLTSLSFDVVLRDVFLPLTSGATLCVPDQGAAARDPHILAWCARQQVTVLHVVPSVARRWLEDTHDGLGAWAPRLVFSAGEPLTASLVDRWRAAFPSARLVNLYGPTETCMVKAWFEVPATRDEGIQPVGRPLPAAQLLVLGPTGQPCGVGEPGQIVIRTPCGTKGYLETTPAADRARFRPNPFRSDPHDIVYDTGDLGRYRRDGILEILGRRDQQVKVRGVRVELREIEAVLETHSLVKAVSVLTLPDAQGEAMLVAYVVAPGTTVEDLRAHLAVRLPSAMMPERVVFLDSLPLTSSGKVDRRALPAPPAERPTLAAPLVTPRNRTEEAVAQIFSALLGVPRVGVHDDFFALGGHSLMATRALVRIQRAFGQQVALRAFFEEPTVAALAARLDSAPDDPPPSATEVPAPPADALTESQRRQVLIAWNSPKVEYPPSDTLIERFEAQVSRTPGAIAVSFEGRYLTYARLAERGERLASRLRALGVGRGTFVGLCLERGLDMVVGLIAILKAGGACVPIDVVYPEERAAFIARDSGAAVIITQSSLVARFAGCGAKVECLDRETPTASAGTQPASSAARPEDPAYVIYTSGTTGRPKGTVVSHHNVVRLFQATEAWFQFGTSDVWTFFHSVAFDFSVWEIWGALLYGGRLVVVPYNVSRNPQEFRQLLSEEAVTVLNQTPSALRQLIEVDRQAESQIALRLRYVILGGEALQMSMLRPWLARHGDETPQVINMYGITETTVHVTYRRVRVADLEEPSLIGRRIPDLRLFILDDRQQPVPVGVEGELYIGGAGVAQGYLNLPELTSEKFVTLSVGGLPAERMYRSGDLARYRPDGDIEYLGRIDHQVKIRGFRIELAEIESVLADHASVRACVVTAGADGPESQRLVAYIVPETGTGIDVSALRQHLKRSLPDYMVPAAFVPLTALPLTNNGKVDRQALPDPAATRVMEPAASPEARGEAAPGPVPVQAAIGRIWAGVLHVDSVGPDDDFFERGGHSLLATKVVARVRDLLGLPASLRDLFESPTLASFTARVTNTGASPTSPTVEEPGGPGDESSGVRIPLSPAQQGLWLLDQLEETPAYNITTCHRLRGLLDVQALTRAFESVIRRQTTLRTRIVVMGSEPGQVVDPPGDFRLDVRDLVCGDNEDLDSAIVREVAAAGRLRFDLARDWPLRACVLRVAPDDHVLVVTSHHIAVDGWSIQVLGRELEAFYRAHRSGAPAGLPALTGQYADFTTWQRETLQGARLQEHLDYWRRQLEGLSPLEVPTDRPRPQRQSFHGARHMFSLDADTSAAVHAFARAEHVTPFAVLLAAFQVLLGRETGRRDIAIGTPVANRLRSEDEHLVGQFVNTVVLRTALDGTSSFRELAQCVWRSALEAFDHQELPFEAIVQALRPTRDLSGNPLVQVLFALQNTKGGDWQFEGLTATRIPSPASHVRLDLELHLYPEPAGTYRGELFYCRDLYEAATGARLARQYAALVRALLAHPDTAIDAVTASIDSETRQPDGVPAPLSFGQQRLWLVDQLTSGQAPYVLTYAFRLRGPLDADALRRSFHTLLERHAALRTTIASEGGEPHQLVQPVPSTVMAFVDLRYLPEGERQVAASRMAAAEAARPFDLAQDLPLRASLVRVGEGEHVLVLVLHHIATDGWSMGILWRELSALYTAFRHGHPSPLAPLPLQYADVARWERDQLRGEALEHLLSYWRQVLAGLPRLEMPTDSPRPSHAVHRGGSYGFELDADLVRRAEGLGLSVRGTLFQTLLTAFQALLSRYTGQDDVAVATPVANRPRHDYDDLIGFFVNTLVLRTKFGEGQSFLEALTQVRNTTLDAFDHQGLPFERLVEELRPERTSGGNPLVQVVLAFQNAPGGTLALDGVVADRLPLARTTTRFDLELHLWRQPEGSVRGHFAYSAELFDAATIERLAANLECLLRGAVTDPGMPVARLPILGQAEQRLLEQWNDTATPLPVNALVHRQFEAQARRTPNAVALRWRDRDLTYGNLNARANRLARVLCARGVGRDVVVAVAMPRSIDVVVSLLAILKTGGAYLPLDLAEPADRLRGMLDDAGARLLVTSNAHAHVAGGALPVLVLDLEAAALAAQDPSDLDTDGTSEDLAYVMYTSGSTGRPKGVEIPHRGVVRLVEADVVPMGSCDAVLQLAPVSFDASTFEIWVPLLRGARCVVYPEPDLDLGVLGQVLARERITRLWLTASLFNTVVDHRLDALAGLEWLLVGGEVLSVPHVSRALAAHPSLKVLNGYGPTEATTFTCVHPISRPLAPDAPPIPIGRPIANTTTYVLDRHRQQVPIGVMGELYVGGPGVARGYRQRDDLTRERFLSNPFTPNIPDTLYKTGDRVRHRADGVLEFLGRTDRQVKVRGFRLEPEEIERAVAVAPGVVSCAVVVREDTPDDKRLVAYVVPARGASLDETTLSRHVRRLLPAYMVPATFVTMTSLPLTPNGKLDRHALPAPDWTGHAEATPPDRLRTPAEDVLARMWRDVLGLESVGLRQSFFALGGHSLLAVRLFSRIEQHFGVRLPLGTLLAHPTIEELATLLEKPAPQAPWSPLVRIREGRHRKPLFLVHGLGGEVLSFNPLALQLPEDLPVFGIQGVAPGVHSDLPVDIEPLCARYAELVMSVDPDGPYFIGGYSSGGVYALELAHQLQARGNQVARLFVIDGGLPANGQPPTGVRHSPWSFAIQFVYWMIDDGLATSPATWWKRIRSNGRLAMTRLRQRVRADAPAPDIRDRLGMWNFPDHYKGFVEERYEAFRRHQPRPYPGRIVLLRSRTGRLFGPPTTLLNERWRRLAQGGLEVVDLPGSHTTVLHGSHVGDLARAIEERMG